MKNISSKIKTIYIIILLLILILFKLNTIAQDLNFMDTSVDLTSIEDKLDRIEFQIQRAR
jgi:uncharacterized integral membrane protein